MSITRAEPINWRVSRMMRSRSSIGMHEVGSYAGTRKDFLGLMVLDGKPVNIDELAFLTVDAGADLKVFDSFERDGVFW